MKRYQSVAAALAALAGFVPAFVPAASPRSEEVFPARLNPAKIQGGTPWSFTADDGATLQGRKWRPSRKPAAVLIALHGTQSHSGWFADLAERLKPHGWAVYAPDRRGSGMNNAGAQRNEKPTPAHSTDWTQWVRDLDATVAAVLQEESRDVPLYLMGSSWSTALCPAYVDPDPSKVPGLRGWKPRYASEVDGLILNVPAGLESNRPGVGQHLRTLLFGVPLTTLGRVITPLRRIGEKIDLPAETYSRHPHTRALVGDKNVPVPEKQPALRIGEQDPLVLHRATYSFFLRSSALREAGQNALKRIQAENARNPDHMPVLSVIAEVDDIGVETSKLENPLPGVVILPQTYHALQIERPDLLADAILTWHRDRGR